MRLIRPAIIIILLFLFSSPIKADIFNLNDGSQVEGLLIEKTQKEYVIQEKGGGKCVVPREWVINVKKQHIEERDLYSLNDIYNQKLKELIVDDGDSQMQLAEWCYKNRLFEYAKKHFMAAASLKATLADTAERRLKVIESLEVERLNANLELLVDAGLYLQAENLALTIIQRYPNADGAIIAREQLIIIWGSKKAEKLIENSLDEKNVFPSVVEHLRTIDAVMRQLERINVSKEKYFEVCLKKGDDFAERAKEISNPETKKNYISEALYCYYVVIYASEEDSKMHKTALNKSQKLSAEYGINNYEEKILESLYF